MAVIVKPLQEKCPYFIIGSKMHLLLLTRLKIVGVFYTERRFVRQGHLLA
jgi:hypothetical protein